MKKTLIGKICFSTNKETQVFSDTQNSSAPKTILMANFERHFCTPYLSNDKLVEYSIQSVVFGTLAVHLGSCLNYILTNSSRDIDGYQKHNKQTKQSQNQSPSCPSFFNATLTKLPGGPGQNNSQRQNRL